MKEVIFSNLPDICDGETSIIPSRDRWQRVHYTAADIKGEMLYAGEMCHPSDLKFKLGSLNSVPDSLSATFHKLPVAKPQWQNRI